MCKVVSKHYRVSAWGIDTSKPVTILHGERRGNTMRYAVSYKVKEFPFRCIGYVTCKDLKQVGHYKGEYDLEERMTINTGAFFG